MDQENTQLQQDDLSNVRVKRPRLSDLEKSSTSIENDTGHTDSLINVFFNKGRPKPGQSTIVPLSTAAPGLDEKSLKPRIKIEKGIPSLSSETQVVYSIHEYLEKWKRISKHLYNFHFYTDFHETYKDLVELERFLKKIGHRMRGLTFDLNVSKGEPVKLLQIISTHCVNLKNLKIQHMSKAGGDSGELYQSLAVPTAEEIDSIKDLPQLKSITICDTSLCIYNLLQMILNISPAIEKIVIEFKSSMENPTPQAHLTQILQVLIDFGEIPTLKTLIVQSDENYFINAEQIDQLAQVQMPLMEKLELGTGLWENVEAKNFTKMLQHFSSTLQNFTVQGALGSYQENFIKIMHIPKMPKLKYFSFQAEYNFDDSSDLPSTSTSSSIANGQNKVKFGQLCLLFPTLDEIKRISLGNTVEMRTSEVYQTPEIHLSNFKNLKVFRVSSNWDKIFKFPSKVSKRRTYPTRLEHLRFPDFLQDPSSIRHIHEEFKSLQVVSLNIPSGAVLQEIFKVFADSQVEKLFLKCRFDFLSTFGSIISGRFQKPSSDEMKKIEMLKAYGKYDEFVKFYKIECPPDGLKEGEVYGVGLGALKSLKFLQVFHISRKLKIPKGDLHWTDPNCEFTNETIGYETFPISEIVFQNQFSQIEGFDQFKYYNLEVIGDTWNKIPAEAVAGEHNEKITLLLEPTCPGSYENLKAEKNEKC